MSVNMWHRLAILLAPAARPWFGLTADPDWAFSGRFLSARLGRQRCNKLVDSHWFAAESSGAILAGSAEAAEQERLAGDNRPPLRDLPRS